MIIDFFCGVASFPCSAVLPEAAAGAVAGAGATEAGAATGEEAAGAGVYFIDYTTGRFSIYFSYATF